MQHIEQLALVFVDALHLHIEQSFAVDLHTHVFSYPMREAVFVGLLGRPEVGHKGGVAGQRGQPRQLRQVATPAFADARIEQARQRRVGLSQPTAWRDAVGFVVESLRPQMSEVSKNRLLHQVGVQG